MTELVAQQVQQGHDSNLDLNIIQVSDDDDLEDDDPPEDDPREDE